MRACTLPFALVLCVACARSAHAQEIDLRGPLSGACIAVLYHRAQPAKLDLATWTSAGVVARERGAGTPADAQLAVGAELTTELARYRGFPSGPYGPHNGLAEIRVGPWVQAATSLPGGLVEAGLKTHVSALYHASWGTFDLRGGLGYGAFAEGRSPHAVATLTYGVRSFVRRHKYFGACDPVPRADAFEAGNVARLFVTARAPLDFPGAHQLVVGIELSPLFFAPPLSWFKVAGGPPPR